MKMKKGFTLIELLVVIAIIGILAAMILVALNTARNKARDARVKSALGQIKIQAELYLDTSTTGYTGFTVNTDLSNDIDSNNGAAGVPTLTFATSPSNVYAVATTLIDGTTTICADSTGKIQTGSTGTAGVCSAGTVL